MRPGRRGVATERLARLRDARWAINEMRPSAAIVAAHGFEQRASPEELAMARRRDALDLELAAFENRLTAIPEVGG